MRLFRAAPFTLLYYSFGWFGSAYTVRIDKWEKVAVQILVVVDPVKRQKLWEQFRDFYLEDANIITLFEIDSARVMNDKFKWPPRSDGWMTFRDVRLSR